MTSKHRNDTSPAGLGDAGAAMWQALTVGDGGDPVEFEPHEAAYVESACRLADRIVELEAAVDAQGVTIAGSAGQTTVHPALVECRLARAEQARLLARVAWPTDAGASSHAGRALARARHTPRSA